jgi:hypothetical protein
MREQDAGLAVATRSDEPDVDAVGGTPGEEVELVLAVDQQLRRYRALERERRPLTFRGGWFQKSRPDGIT